MSETLELVCHACGSRQMDPNGTCAACGEPRFEVQADAGDARKVSKAEAKAKRIQREDDAILRSIMATAPGRGWFYRMLQTCHLFHTSFDGNPLVMAMKEGERNIGLALLADVMRVCPENYVLMSNEATTR